MRPNGLIKLPTGYWLLIETEGFIRDDGICEVRVQARLERFLFA